MTTGCPIINIRIDGAGENSAEVIANFCERKGIMLDYSPKYTSESNVLAERFMQELGMRARVLLFAATYQ